MLLLAACAGSEDSQPAPNLAAPIATVASAESDAAATAPDVAPKMTSRPAIASVALIQDCGSGSTGARGAVKSKAKRSRACKPGAGPCRPAPRPCTQSTLQIAFSTQGADTVAVTLGTLRLKTSAGLELAELVARSPTLWRENGYKEWDGMLPASVDSKVSYSISVPDWSAVEAAVGGSSFDQMYVLEVEVSIGGETSTVTSPQFERARPRMIKT